MRSFRLMHLPLTNRQALKSASHHPIAIKSIILAPQLWYNSKSIVRPVSSLDCGVDKIGPMLHISGLCLWELQT